MEGEEFDAFFFQKNLQTYTQMDNYEPMLKRAYLFPYQKEPIIEEWKRYRTK